MDNPRYPASFAGVVHSQVAMHPYSEKVELARQQIARQEFPRMYEAGGREWAGARYHLMYTEWFSGYFFYKISGVAGKLESVEFLTGEKLPTGSTWWGFYIQIASDKEHRDEFEQPLPATEVKAWLRLNYGQLEADDYEHLISILHLERTPDGSSVHHLRNNYNWQQALAWLTEQHARAIAFAAREPKKLPLPSSVVSCSTVSTNLSRIDTQSKLSPAERILEEDFSMEEADKLAFQVELIDEQGRYCLGPRKLSAIVGFCQALKEKGKLLGTIPKLTAVIGSRYGVEIRTRKGTSTVANTYYQATKKLLR